MQTAIVPSIIASGRPRNIGALEMGLDRRGRRNRNTDPLVIGFDGQFWMAGNGVWRHARRPLERLSFSSLGNGQFGRVMTYAAFGSILSPGRYENVRILTGLPVQVLEDMSVARSIMTSLRSWLVARHVFTVNGEDFEVNVAEVRAMAQPLGGLFAWAYENGAAPSGSIGVVDPGFNTLDLYVIEDMRVSPVYTTGNTVGVHQAAKAVAEEVRRLTGVTISLRQADEYLRSQRSLSVRGHDLRSLVDAARNANAVQIIQEISMAWDNLLADHIIAVGGGAALHQDAIRQNLPHVQILPEPATANARGLALYGRRKLWERTANPHEHIIGLDPGFGAYKAALG